MKDRIFIKNKYSGYLVLSALVLSFVSCALRTLSLVFFYDADVAYYREGAVLPIVSDTLFALSIALFAVLALIIPKDERSQPMCLPDKSARLSAIVPAVALVLQVIGIFGASGTESNSTLPLIIGACALISTVFFATLAFSAQPSPITALTGVGFMIWAALSWYVSYADFYVPMNSPDKLYFHLACISAALFAIEELRVSYSFANTRLYLFSLSASILALTTEAIPSLIAGFTGVFRVYNTKAEDLVLFALLIYLATRAVRLLWTDDSRTESTRPNEEQKDTAPTHD